MLSIEVLEPLLRTELAKRNCHPEAIKYGDELAALGFDSSSVLRVISILEDLYELDYESMTGGIWRVADIARMIP
ncbi:hypothetical protein [Nocardia concava]|uniref:hypothetical protein n=1 Tax=Nocardia concava TaxID=257281 RepID=UPI0005927B35|nr:hypothetical protein [Nocardia concava]